MITCLNSRRLNCTKRDAEHNATNNIPHGTALLQVMRVTGFVHSDLSPLRFLPQHEKKPEKARDKIHRILGSGIKRCCSWRCGSRQSSGCCSCARGKFRNASRSLIGGACRHGRGSRGGRRRHGRRTQCRNSAVARCNKRRSFKTRCCCNEGVCRNESPRRGRKQRSGDGRSKGSIARR